MKTLYVLNYQREIPPFVQIEISYAKKQFDHVVYITRKLTTDNSTTISDNNVKVIQLGFVRRLNALLTLILLLFVKPIRSQLFKACKDHVFSLEYIKQFLIELYISEQLYKASVKHARHSAESKNYVIASWFNGIAIAAARLQDRNDFKAYSFAHAFEITPHRNPYLGYMMEDYKHRCLTKIIFIAKVMYKQYAEYVYPIIGIKKNVDVSYLGSRKLFQNKQIKDNVFNICSCSTVTAIKRLDLIIDALSFTSDIPISWTHIGNGPEFDRIKHRVEKLLERNKNVEIHLLGKCTNEEVQEFYSRHYVDMFINVSESEGLPISIMEAMSYSIPCVATDVGGTKEIVNNNNGFLIGKDTLPAELYKVIFNYICKPDYIKEQYRNNAYLTWTNSFDSDNNFISLFSAMIN